MKEKHKLGISLSGGGARGFGHIGILKALNEHDIFPTLIIGASAGAIVGAFYADGKSPDEIFDIFKSQKGFNLTGLTLFKKGLLSTSKLFHFLEDHLYSQTFEELKLHFTAALVNINSGEIEYFDKGNLPVALQASSAFPGVFESVKIKDNWYCDGGLVNNMPVSPFRDKCDFIIGVNVNPPLTYKDELEDFKEMVFRMLRIFINTNTEPEISACDLYICPPELGAFEINEMRKSKEIYEAGYDYIINWLRAPENEEVVQRLQRVSC